MTSVLNPCFYSPRGVVKTMKIWMKKKRKKKKNGKKKKKKKSILSWHIMKLREKKGTEGGYNSETLVSNNGQWFCEISIPIHRLYVGENESKSFLKTCLPPSLPVWQKELLRACAGVEKSLAETTARTEGPKGDRSRVLGLTRLRS